MTRPSAGDKATGPTGSARSGSRKNHAQNAPTRKKRHSRPGPPQPEGQRPRRGECQGVIDSVANHSAIAILSCRFVGWATRSALRSLPEKPFEKRPRFLANPLRNGIQATLVQRSRRPPVHQARQDPDLFPARRQPTLCVSCRNAQTVIDRPVKRCRIPQPQRVFPIQMSHLLHDVDPLGRVQHLVRRTPALRSRRYISAKSIS